ncbi:farnesol dehydrogenase-like [Teleopsis dalmanni]|uniref:farnesol dehydrogenase-like n=1 Tax=Teleopsis dalmanni TaxID=139649 RepID=UPI0018CDA37C|nr:farnesol dehydrogenase-like [Teleopsis dalmanni]
MERWLKSVAVVTGASSGIGAAIAKDLANAGLIVVALARRIERVEEIRAELSPKVQPNFYAIKCDVTDRNAVNETFDWIEENLGGIDILINNAGTLFTGQIVTADIDKMQNVLQTNIMGVVLCTQRAFKSMKARKVDGHIVNINSITGHYIPSLAEPLMMNIYPASKYAITAINEIVRQEVRDLGTRIKITVSFC